MARGLVSGMVWGALVSVVGLGAVSVAVDPPELANQGAAAPAPATPARVPEASVDAAPDPEVARVTDDGSAADTPAAPPADGSAPVQPVAPKPETGASAVPAATSESPDAPAMADTPGGETAPAMEASVDSAPAPAPATEAPGQPQAADSVNETGVAISGDAPVEAPGEGASMAQAPEAEADPNVETAAARPQSDTSPAAEADEVRPDTPADASRIGQGSSDLSRLAPDVRTGRLPRLGNDTAEPSTEEAASDTSPRPIEAFAVAVDVADDAPKLAIILIDDGNGGFGSEALGAFPYPLSFAVNSASPNAADRAADYRARGFEVLAMGGLPEGATPQDAEVALSALLAAVPEAIGVIETPDAGLQGDRTTATQVARILAQSGHGLVLFPKGLNTAAAIAEKEGVPVASVFRDLDAQGQSPGQIRRLLDQAALRADSDGPVLLTARLRPDTISALLLWGLQDRTGRLALVPASRALNETPR